MKDQIMSNPSAPAVRPVTMAALSLLTWHYCGAPAQANPTGGTVAQGAASISSAGSQLTVNVATTTAAINWQSFNIGAGETTTFVQPSSSSVVWNQINDGNPSQIMGSLNANGYVILQNQNGFAVGGAAAISAHGLIMTTSATPPPNLAGGGSWTFNAPPLSAKIINLGQINITGGGSAFLIANDIENQGTVSAPGGKIGLYAGEQVLVSQSADGLALSTSVTLPQGSVDNEGNLIANAESIAAQAQTVNQSDLVQANSAQYVNGSIELVAGDSLTLGAKSVLEANGPTSTSAGGTVVVQSGNTLDLDQGSTITAEGGKISVQAVTENNAGKLIADAGAIADQAQTLNQNGLIQANSVNYVNGSIELVGSDSLTLGAQSDLEANGLTPTGSGGTVNLQAGDALEAQAGSTINVTGYIQGGHATVTLQSGNILNLDQGSAITAEGGKISLQAATENNAGKLIADAGAIVDAAQILNQNGLVQANSAQYDNGSIELVASDSLTLGALSDLEANGLTPTSAGGSVKLQAGGFLEAQAGSIINVSGSAQGGVIGQPATVTAQAGNTINLGHGSAINAAGGKISLQAASVNQSGLLQANSVNAVTGAITIDASGTINLGAGSDIEAHGDNRAVNTAASPGGSVSLQAGTGFADQSGSVINVSGSTVGGTGGQAAIAAPQMTAVNSSINAQANPGFADGTLTITTDNILLNSDGSPASGTLALNVNSLASGFSQIDLQASGSLELNAQWNLPFQSSQLDTVSLSAGEALTVDSGAELAVAGGKIALNAGSVTLNGTLQANSVGAANGVIDVVGSGAISLGPNAIISANGDATATGPSPGGFVVLQAGTTFNDTASTTINVAGGAGTGGVSGIIEIFGNNVANATLIQSQIDCLSAAQFNFLLLNPYDLTISTSLTTTAPTAATATTAAVPANLNTSDLNDYSQIDIHAQDNIELQTAWLLTGPGSPAALNLRAGNSIIMDDQSAINAGYNWGVNLTAGTGFTPTPTLPVPMAGSDGIYLNGNAYVSTANGNINLWAANEVQIATGTIDPVGNNGIRTLTGGNVTVTAGYGNVNTGANAQGYAYKKTAPYTTVSPVLGGISTVAGGNVTINAGGDVTSFLPGGAASDGDGGTGAFGPEPGNVTVNAGGNVYGHYVLANGVGTISAGNSIGIPSGTSVAGTEEFALSLVDGTWSVNAPNGNIYLQEVRNPNGIFNTTSGDDSAGAHLFNYGPQAAVDLTAGIGVYLTGLIPVTVTGPVQDLPRPEISGQQQDDVPVIYPPILDISAGSGGVNLLGPVTLFPSAYQSLSIITTGGGNLKGIQGESTPTELLMSDSSSAQWVGGNYTFGDLDHSAGLPIQAANPNPAVLNISGEMDYLNLVTSKATEITVTGNVIDCGFSGQNLAASDVTSLTVGGAIENYGSYFSVSGVSIPSVPDTDLLPGMSSSWNNIFTLAVNPAALANLTLTPTTTALDILQAASVFGVTVQNKQAVANTENFYYDLATETLAVQGTIIDTAYAALGTPGQPLYVLHLVNGLPQIGASGQLVLDQVSWAPTSVVDTLATESLNALPTGGVSLGYRVGGPGQFDINAGSISLGDSSGILSCGVTDPQNGLSRYTDLTSITPSGATVNVTVSGDLSMLSSTIAALGGGDVNVVSTGGSLDLGVQELTASSTSQVGPGIFTSGAGNVNVTAFSDINIDGSRIATFDGGNIFVESLTGTVNIGSGSPTYHGVYVSFVNPAGQAADYVEFTYGSGIVANTLVPPGPDETWPPNPATAPGNITVDAPRGDIVASLGGITQEALGVSTPSGPTITLNAGTFPSGTPGTADYFAGYPGNIDLGESGVIGGTVNATANGNLTASIIARQNVNATASQTVNVAIVAGGQADVSGQTVSGLAVGGQGVDMTGVDVTAVALGQNVSVNGGASQSTLGSSAAATSTSQAAANQSDNQAKTQLANDDGNADDDKKKKLQPVIQRVKRVTVILPDKTVYRQPSVNSNAL